ncbi:MAG: NADH-quinone oxidoreductase subunit C [Candidatus Omnitrophica bacterium]|nr:NADH-quinone oxidoreductase subunit C [Candidatus Omnitrophota bacterium]MCM8794109.1 NADH-quinone oxidoreductase subunit C [Candidatus Omnitrophota bacterium]
MEIKDKIKERLKECIIDWYEHSERRVYFSVKPEDILGVVKVIFKELNLRLSTATGVDTPQGIEIIYHFSFDRTGEIFSVKVLIKDKEKPEIDSITPIIKGAEWIEREMWELLGINFKGHPNLKHLLLIEDWPEGKFPLRRKRESL